MTSTLVTPPAEGIEDRIPWSKWLIYHAWMEDVDMDGKCGIAFGGKRITRT